MQTFGVHIYSHLYLYLYLFNWKLMPQLPVYWPFIEFDLTYKCPTGLLSDSRNQYIGHTQLLIFLKVYSKGQGFILK